MTFVNSGTEALHHLSEHSFDVIVSDMQMPGMDGAQLLTGVMKNYPGVVRIILSGHSKKEMILKSVGAAHQYLAKPCEPSILKATIERACSLRAMLADNDLKQIVAKLDSLPSLPNLYIEINNEIRSSDSSLKKVGEIISKDAGMTAKILQLVNSAFFGFYSRITSVNQAVTLLGLDTVRALVTSIHIFSEIKRTKVGPIGVEDLWNHFFSVGAMAREIMKLESGDTRLMDESFMAGMLHDIGKIIFITNLAEKYETTLDSGIDSDLSLSDIETKSLGADHSSVGGYLLGLWGLPDSIIEAVFFHHRPGESHENSFGVITAVHVANAIAARENPGYTVGALSEIDRMHIERIGKTDRIPVWEKKGEEILHRV